VFKQALNNSVIFYGVQVWVRSEKHYSNGRSTQRP
jgi:hypothetical protein